MGYFKPWRRKIGVLTLVMALALMGLWLRSLSKLDSVALNGSPWQYVVSSGFGQLHIWQTSHQVGLEPMRIAFGEKLKNVEGYNYQLGFIRLCFMSSGNSDEVVRLCFIPFWVIVIPLTLLSAYLLLSKPSKSTQMKIPDTTSAPEKVI